MSNSEVILQMVVNRLEALKKLIQERGIADDPGAINEAVIEPLQEIIELAKGAAPESDQ
jgi:hypothetical protein